MGWEAVCPASWPGESHSHIPARSPKGWEQGERGGYAPGWGLKALSHKQGCPPTWTRLPPAILFAGTWTCLFRVIFSIPLG